MVNSILLRRWYIIMAGLTTVAALQAIIFPRWPTAKPLNQSQLDSQIKSIVQGAERLPSRPPTRTYDFATSAQLIWKFPGGESLTLMRGASRELANFQAAFLARADPSLQIKNRILLSSPLPVASGTQHGLPILQTCVLNESDGQRGIGVTGSQLNKARSELSSGHMQRFYEFLGLSSSSVNSCILVTLKGTSKQSYVDTLPLKKVLKAIVHAIAPSDHPSRQSG